MATKDFVVKSGLQVRSNVVVGTYSNNVTPILNGMAVSGGVGVGTSTLAASTKFEVQGGNIKIGSSTYGLVFPDGSFQNTAATSTNPGGTTGAVQYNSGTGFGGDASNFYYDSTNYRLGIGTSGLTTATLNVWGSLPAWFNTTRSGDAAIIVGNSISTGTTLAQASDLSYSYVKHNASGSAMISWNNTGVGINNLTAPKNALDVNGGAVIGGSIGYAGTATAPSNGLLVAGSVGIGTISTSNKLYVYGGNVQIDTSSRNYGIIFSDGTYQSTAFNSSSAVTSFSAGTTGLTPGTGTTGAVTLAGTLNAANGGTGQNTYAVGDILFASAATTLSKLADVATGNVIISGGVGVAPSYGKVGLTTHVTGTLPIANGGTNATATPTAGAVSYGTGSAYAFTGAGTSGNVLISGGAGAPTWGLSYSTSALGNSLVSRDVSGNITAALGTFSGILSTGAANIAVSTASTSTTTGAIITAGGVGIAGNLNVGGVTLNTGNVGVGTSAVTGITAGNALAVFGNAQFSSNVFANGFTGTYYGAWNGSTIGVGYGGTGLTSYTTGDIVYASGASTLASLADVATGNVLISGGVGVAPIYGKVGLTTHVTGTLPVANGGTGLTSGTSGGVLYYSAAGTLASSGALAASSLVVGGGAGAAPSTITTGTGVVTALGVNTGTAGAFVVNGGALGTPSSGNLINATSLPLTTGVTGTLPIANGGTNGTATPTAGAVSYGTGTAYAFTSAGTSGNILISGGAGAPTWGQSYTTSNVPNSVVSRDASGNFSAGTITAGTGLTVSAGGINVTGFSQITGNLNISGNLVVTGNINTLNSNVLVVSDPIIYVGDNNPANTWDLGIVSSYTSDRYRHTGFLRNQTDGVWTIFDNLITEPTQTINWSQAGLNFGSFKVGNINVAASTASTSTTSGALTVVGGVGIGGNIYGGANVVISTAGKGVVFGDGTFQTTAYPGSTGVVTTFSAGTTGLTPSTATSGAVTLGGTLAAANGGTGQSSYTQGDLLYASGATTIGKLSDVATGNVLISGGVGADPSWGKVGLTTHVTGTLPVANGGTGLTSGTSGGVLYYSAAGTLASSAALAASSLVVGGGAGVAPSTITTGTGVTTALGVNTGTAGAFVVNGGALGTPSSGNLISCTALPLTTGVTGTLPVANGGTGLTSGTSGGVLYYSASGTLTSSAALAANSIVIGGGAGVAPSTITTGTGVVTALGVNTGTAGAFVVNGGALGTPSSGNLINATSLPLTTGVTGTLPVANGGTNATATPTAGAVSYGTGTAYAFTTAGTSGNVLISGGAGAPTWGQSYTSSNVANSIVGRDASGNFAAGTATLSGLLSTGQANVAVATASTTTTTGAIITSGGVGVAGNLNVGGVTLNTGNVGVGTSTVTGITAGNVLAIFGNAQFSSNVFANGFTGTHYGAWNGSAIGVTYGGTGLTSYTTGDILFASGASTLASLADVATGNVIISGGVGVAPSYGKVGLTTHVTGTLPVANGGTGLTSGTSGGVLYYSASGTLASSAALAASALVVGGGAGVAPSTITTGTGVTTALGVNTGTAGAFVVNGGALGTPSSGNLISCTALPLTTGVTGTLPIANGGTNGTATPTAGAVPYGTGTAYAFTGAGTSGNILISGGAGAPTWGQSYTSSNVPNSVVSRDASGNFSAANVTVTGVTLAQTVDYTSTYTSSTTAQQTVDSFASATYRAAEYQISITSSTSYEIVKVTVIHDGTNGYAVEYDNVFTNVTLATFDASVSGGNCNLLVTPVNASTTFKVARKLWLV